MNSMCSLRNRRSARLALGFPPPELPKLPLPPSDYRLWFHEDQLGCPVSPDLWRASDQNSRSLFLSLGFFALRLYTLSCCLSARIRNQDHPVEPREDNQIESWYDHEYK